jgi:1-acyl-sn-glycerol-3-phosphate acyltransferase
MIPELNQPPYADYASEVIRPGIFTRSLPTAAFYSQMTRVILAAARQAKRGNFDDNDWYDASMRVREVFERSGARIIIKGTENLALLEGSCLIIGNHMSTAETFLLASVILPFRRVTFVVKQSLVEYPIFKHIMRSRDPIVVGRVNPREDLKAVLGGGRERLEAGISIVIFPQRTRTVTFDREAFNTIGIKLAKRAAVPVIPLALKTNAWSNGTWFKDYGPFRPEEDVRFEFGEPITVTDSDRDAHEAVMEFISSRLTEWGVPVK